VDRNQGQNRVWRRDRDSLGRGGLAIILAAAALRFFCSRDRVAEADGLNQAQCLCGTVEACDGSARN
jgi:hypothetical protein